MRTERADMDLIRQVLDGDQSAYGILVDRYKNFVFTIVLRYIKLREDAEEVAQDVFIKAYRSLADFRRQSKFSTWLYTVATSTAITYLRKKKVDLLSLDDDKSAGIANQLDGGMSANLVERKSKLATVNEAIGMLSPEDAQVIILFYKAEQTLEEIAAILGKEANTVKVQLHRARGKMKEKMEKHFAFELKDF